jgi:hypothetical protein
VKPLTLYAIARIVFGVASLAAPAVTGRTLAGPGGALPDAQAFLRGMGGREIGFGLCLLADVSDLAGIAGAWQHMARAKRWLGLGTAGGAAAAGVAVLASSPR